MIYFMQPVQGGPIKIGTTGNLAVRHKSLEGHYSCPLALLATLEGGRKEEAEIHERFAHLRLGRTEQFRPAPDLLRFIGKPLLVGANPEATEVLVPVTQLVAMRCKAEFKVWLERFAENERSTPAQLIELGLVEMAKLRAFEQPPRR